MDALFFFRKYRSGFRFFGVTRNFNMTLEIYLYVQREFKVFVKKYNGEFSKLDHLSCDFKK